MDDLDLKAKTLRVRATRLRPVYEHGCDGRCGKTAGYCPDRRQRNGPTGATKSSAGNRASSCPTNSLPSSSLIAEPRSPNAYRRVRFGGRAAGSSRPGSVDPSFPTPTTSNGRRSFSALAYGMPVSTTLATPQRPCCLCSASPNERSCRSWLVEHIDGSALPARHRPNPPRGRKPRGWPALPRGCFRRRIAQRAISDSLQTRPASAGASRTPREGNRGLRSPPRSDHAGADGHHPRTEQ